LEFAAFGCSLDALDAPEKVSMKRAYVEARSRGIVGDELAGDPYDLLLPRLADIPGLEAAGRLELEPWVTPRPSGTGPGNVSAEAYREFLDSGGCLRVAACLRDFVRERVFPFRPLLLGVDHSLTGGVLEALHGQAGGHELNVIVLDSHFDAIPAAIRKEAAQGALSDEGGRLDSLPESYNCGTWLARALESGVILPGNLVVIGTSDYPGHEPGSGEMAGMAAYREAYVAFEERGVRIIPKRVLRERGIREAVGEALAGMKGRVYVSLDADLGAGCDVNAVRFLDTVGLSADEMLEVGRSIARVIDDKDARLAGLDVMEIDVHLADLPESEDRTLEVCAEMVNALTYGVL